MVTTRFLGNRRNGYDVKDQTKEVITNKVARALHILQNLPSGNASWNEVEDVKEAFHLLDNITDYMPRVECWCVVKKYADPSWADSIWIGCENADQAASMATALLKHSQSKQDHPYRDSFVAEYKPCRILDIIRPDVTTEEYIDSLR